MTWLYLYLSIVLDCDFPIVEALHYNTICYQIETGLIQSIRQQKSKFTCRFINHMYYFIDDGQFWFGLHVDSQIEGLLVEMDIYSAPHYEFADFVDNNLNPWSRISPVVDRILQKIDMIKRIS